MDTILTIYDCITRQEICFKRGDLGKQCVALGLDYTSFSHLQSGRQKSVADRYILSNKKELLFILVDFVTDQEYECVNNRTIFVHLGIPYSENGSKYVYDLKKQRQKLSSIGERLFYLKGNKPLQPFTKTKCEHLPIVFKTRTKNQLKSKIVHALRNRLWYVLKRQLATRADHTLTLTGCTLETLIQHLESQFKTGMTWENYGKWHIDHIKPCISFDMFKEDDQRRCFHYTNLQPLWAVDNYIKGRKIL